MSYLCQIYKKSGDHRLCEIKTEENYPDFEKLAHVI